MCVRVCVCVCVCVLFGSYFVCSHTYPVKCRINNVIFSGVEQKEQNNIFITFTLMEKKRCLSLVPQCLPLDPNLIFPKPFPSFSKIKSFLH